MVERASNGSKAQHVSLERTDRPVLALMLRLFGITGFALMAVLIKLSAQSGIHLVELIFWRQFASLPILIAWAMLTGGLMQLSTKRPKAHAVRAGYGVVGMVLNFGGVILLPLAEATTLGFTAPIFAVLLSIILLRETVGIWRWSAVGAGFLGIIIIAQPGGGQIPLFGALVALGGAFMIALISIQIRDLSRTDNPIVIVFWFSVGTVAVGLIPMLFLFEPHTTRQWLYLLGIGVFGTLGQVMFTMALRFGKVSSVVVMDYTSIIWATLYGWLFFATLPGATLWLGAPIVVLSGLIITWRERVVAKRDLIARHQASGT